MPRIPVVRIAVPMVVGVIGVTWLLDEVPAPSNPVVEHDSLSNGGRIHTSAPRLEDAIEFPDNDGLADTGEATGVGKLVIALHDGALFPLTDEQVRLHRPGGAADEVIALTDHQGEAAFEGLVEGAYLYTVEAIGHPLLVASAPVVVRPGETTVLTLQVRDHDQAIGGWVLDRNGAPVSGVEVTAKAHRLASGTGAPPLRRSSAASARADAAGRFEIADLQTGEYEISTEADERYVAASVIVRAGVDSVMLTMDENRMHRIEGTISSANGERLAGVKVVPPPGSSAPALTDLEGRYALTLNDGGAVGRRYLRFLLDGYQETRVVLESLFDPGEPVTVVDTTLTPLGATVSVSGRVTDEYGNAVAGERVQFHSRARYTTYRTTSGPDGEFVLEGVAVSDDYHVWVRPQGPYGDYRGASVALTNDEPYLDIVLPALATGTVHGRVLDGQHNPVPYFHFWLRSDSAESKALPVTADADGSFAAEQVPAGRLTLGTRSLPHVRITDIELAAGAVQYIEVVLDPGDKKSAGVAQ